MKKFKTKMRATSILAFVEILGSLGLKEKIVFQAIQRIQPCSDKMLAEYLGWKINRITGRRNSLSNTAMVIPYKKDIDKIPPFKKVQYWIIPSYNNAILEKPEVIK